jgi:hypothetical protein
MCGTVMPAACMAPVARLSDQGDRAEEQGGGGIGPDPADCSGSVDVL